MWFNKKKIPETALPITSGMVSIKDLIAPPYVEIDFNHITIDKKLYRTLFVVGYPREVTANWLHTLITFDEPLQISMFIYPTDSADTLKVLERKIGEMGATIQGDINEGKVVDPTIQAALDDAFTLQAELAQGSERFFQFAFYITIPADSLEELDSKTHEVTSILSSLLLINKVSVLEMEEGFKSTIPLFQDKLSVWRNMDTSSLAYTFPFSSATLTSNTGILYGINQHDKSLVLFDRFSLETANSVILGKSGGGKSFLVKLEVMRLLMMGIDVIIIDPENEYEKITQTVKGEFLSFSLTSDYKINPFELNTQEPDENELNNKILNIHGLMKVIMGELTPVQDALLDKALMGTYSLKGITSDKTTWNNEPPLLEDLYKVFMGYETQEALDLATRLEKFIKGSATGVFNQASNFDIRNMCTVFGIRDIEENLRPVIMFVLLDFIWNKIRRDKKKRILVVDEAWYLIKNK
ncbi:MAG: VirB4 family type IV secretion system protein, partial [Candidatus Roizmanbacteria bacterium]